MTLRNWKYIQIELQKSLPVSKGKTRRILSRKILVNPSKTKNKKKKENNAKANPFFVVCFVRINRVYSDEF